MRVIIYTFSILFFFATITIAQEIQDNDQEPLKTPITISGSIDGYFRYGFQEQNQVAPPTSFANLPGFSLGMANVVFAQESKTIGFKADLVFGPRGEDATFLSPVLRPGGSSGILNQLYAFWKVSESVKITLGNFNTFLGYEVISPSDNFNYSTSYLFSFGPFSHTGVKADISLANGFSVMAGIFNPTDATEYNPLNSYTAGVQLAYENENMGLWLNGLFADDYTQLDITANWQVNKIIYLGFNASTLADGFAGSALYFQVAAASDLKFGLRGEAFSPKDLELMVEEDEMIYAATFSANFTIGSLTLIPEFRLDSSSDQFVFTDTYQASTVSSFLLAAVYNF